MSIDKAKESAAIAAVNEQINNVGRRIEKQMKIEKLCLFLECSYYWCWIRFNYCSSCEKNWYEYEEKYVFLVD